MKITIEIDIEHQHELLRELLKALDPAKKQALKEIAQPEQNKPIPTAEPEPEKEEVKEPVKRRGRPPKDKMQNSASELEAEIVTEQEEPQPVAIVTANKPANGANSVIPKAAKEATSIRALIDTLWDSGYANVEQLVTLCETHKAEFVALNRVADVRGRLERAIAVMGLGEADASSASV